MLRKTKIVCTIGPSTDQVNILEQMIDAGMNIARFNFSHGTLDEQGERMKMVRTAAANKSASVSLMLDTKGPEMRLGKFAKGKVNLVTGQKFRLTTRDMLGTEEAASVNFPLLHKEVVAGDQILLSDGLIRLKVETVEGQEIITTVQNSGLISDRKRVAVPGVPISLPPVSQQDIRDILYGIKQDVDFIAASFIQRAADVLTIRKILEDQGSDAAIIAKIENAAGVANIEKILRVADGIMVARGDLGVEIPAEEVPLVQKDLIKKANAVGKPVITATHMLESMLTNPRPTRAEASDIANAIFDGTDAIMLSGETASGQYPVEAVSTMARIAHRVEKALNYSEMGDRIRNLKQRSTTDAISHATVRMSSDLEAAAIITSTASGRTARMVSRYRPAAAIVAESSSIKTVKKLTLSWGVYPVLGQESRNSDDMVKVAVDCAIKSGIVNIGDLVIITAGVPKTSRGATNMIRVYSVGNVLLSGVGIGRDKASGSVCVVKQRKDIKSKEVAGSILVIKEVDDDIAREAVLAKAIITEEGGLTSQAAIIGISFGIPVIVDVEGACDRMSDGLQVTVDAERGLIYEGNVQIR